MVGCDYYITLDEKFLKYQQRKPNLVISIELIRRIEADGQGLVSMAERIF